MVLVQCYFHEYCKSSQMGRTITASFTDPQTSPLSTLRGRLLAQVTRLWMKTLAIYLKIAPVHTTRWRALPGGLWTCRTMWQSSLWPSPTGCFLLPVCIQRKLSCCSEYFITLGCLAWHTINPSFRPSRRIHFDLDHKHNYQCALSPVAFKRVLAMLIIGHLQVKIKIIIRCDCPNVTRNGWLRHKTKYRL